MRAAVGMVAVALLTVFCIDFAKPKQSFHTNPKKSLYFYQILHLSTIQSILDNCGLILAGTELSMSKENSYHKQ